MAELERRPWPPAEGVDAELVVPDHSAVNVERLILEHQAMRELLERLNKRGGSLGLSVHRDIRLVLDGVREP